MMMTDFDQDLECGLLAHLKEGLKLSEQTLQGKQQAANAFDLFQKVQAPVKMLRRFEEYLRVGRCTQQALQKQGSLLSKTATHLGRGQIQQLSQVFDPHADQPLNGRGRQQTLADG